MPQKKKKQKSESTRPAQEAPRYSETHLSAIIQSTADGIIAVDAAGRVLMANNRFYEIWQIPQELREKRDNDAILEYVLEQLADPQTFLNKTRTLYASTDEALDTIYFKDGRIFERYSCPLTQGRDLIGRVWSFRDITENKQVERALSYQNKWFEALFKNSTEAIVLFDSNHCVLDINQAFTALFKYELAEIKGMSIDSVIDMGKQDTSNRQYTEAVLAGKTITGEAVRYNKDGSPVEVLIKGIPIIIDVEFHGGFGIYADITERKQAEETLRKSELRNRALVEAIPDMLFRYNREGYYLDAEARDEHLFNAQGNQAGHETSLIGKKIADLMPPDVAALLMEAIHKAIHTGNLQVVEYSYPVENNKLSFEARLVATGSDEVVSIVRDITERKCYEAQLEYLSLRDTLTGLYNRAYYENELQRLKGGREYPVAILSADLDGLKLINDTLGHKEGDRILQVCAAVLKKSLRKSDILARVGGDEFVLIMPRTDGEAMGEVVARIRREIEQYNEKHQDLPISISLGTAVSKSAAQSLEETYKNADSLMYRDKLSHSENARNRIVKALLTALAERDYVAEGHIERLQEHCWKLGNKAGLNMHQLTDLLLLAQVHDLGKVGIPDRILLKKGKLTEQEWEIMRQHPEKGYRIASSSPDLSNVADLILRHHENWDGSGYPLGLQGKEIPIECRILAIVDAYDSMVSPRSYSGRMSAAEAASELKHCAGSQFDPELVDLYLSVLDT
ncbi:MAG: diguanylate cyclase [Bacillota bacterium]